MRSKKLLLLPAVTLVFCVAVPILAGLYGGKTSDPPEYTPGMTSSPELPETVQVLLADTGEVREFPLEEYIEGVVAAEMPASYDGEALKAQAVAARTYTLYKKLHGGSGIESHKGADVCTDYHHCKAYSSDEKLRQNWGENYDTYRAKIHEAVSGTAGEILVYGGEPINAVFHAISSGRTENVSEVWGGELPYLKSVESEGDALADGYESTARFSMEEFYTILESAGCPVDREADRGSIVSGLARTEGGSVASIRFFGTELRGTKVRTLFSLRSANFELAFEGEEAVFTVKGYGHGVGMSQQGANYMAKNGYLYKDILTKYYTGTEIVKKS